MATMSLLCRRMIEGMTVRNLSPATQQSYLYAVAKFSRHFGVPCTAQLPTSTAEQKGVGWFELAGAAARPHPAAARRIILCWRRSAWIRSTARSTVR